MIFKWGFLARPVLVTSQKGPKFRLSGFSRRIRSIFGLPRFEPASDGPNWTPLTTRPPRSKDKNNRVHNTILESLRSKVRIRSLALENETLIPQVAIIITQKRPENIIQLQIFNQDQTFLNPNLTLPPEKNGIPNSFQDLD